MEQAVQMSTLMRQFATSGADLAFQCWTLKMGALLLDDCYQRQSLRSVFAGLFLPVSSSRSIAHAPGEFRSGTLRL